ncbi:Protocadherin gamma-B5 [Schistosoma japonicum]|uniref:Protocadherin gamma-B5 n=1 Tax=Schistosoma japonicum TaxID=6182 RepID=A0A4Z2D2B5_SCHJA|nr:Protocadherin gamma-B5 [Schistosoma japonicum]
MKNFNHDCIVTLRIATFTENIQKIYQIHVIIEDINDNPPKWSVDKITIYFHDDDPPGTKQSIPLAKDLDIGINAKITYQLLNIDINFNENKDMHLYMLNEIGNSKLHGTEMFELVSEKGDFNHYGDERLFLTARHTLDRETRPQGWDLILLATNNEGSIPMSGRLFIHINLTDVNDNSPIFSQSIYKPQLPNQKVGSIPEDYPVGKTILRIHATDADEGKNAEITYSFAPDSTNQLIRHFFEMTKDGELRVIRPLNVDIKTQQNTNVPYLPTTVMSFDVIAVDGAAMAYAKTGYATIQIEVENIDDEAPEIRIHPIQSLQDTSLSNDHRSHETEVAVSENQPPGQLIALVEVKDPDVITQSISQCVLTGPNAINFRLSYQDSANNEYRLYTSTKLDREKQSQVLLSVECKDLADHVASNNIIIHVLDVNDHAPQCSDPHYRFALYEDDGEQDHLELTMMNRSWLTPNGQAYVLAKDDDIGINSEITYHLSIEFEENLKGRFSVDSKTGQLFAWGPFDREHISSHEFIIVATDNGKDVQLSTKCSVTVKILDVNDNPPIFHPQLGITGGYLFNIRENQLPGTRVGQIEAYDLDSLPASTDIADLFSHLDKSNSLLTSNIPNVNNEYKGITNNLDKKLTYSLKNEHNSQAFRIDQKTGVIITRSDLVSAKYRC